MNEKVLVSVMFGRLLGIKSRWEVWVTRCGACGDPEIETNGKIMKVGYSSSTWVTCSGSEVPILRLGLSK